MFALKDIHTLPGGSCGGDVKENGDLLIDGKKLPSFLDKLSHEGLRTEPSKFLRAFVDLQTLRKAPEKRLRQRG